MTTNLDKLNKLGWLDENGICHFPDDVLGVVLGYKAKALPITALVKMTPEQLKQAVEKGWIQFADANATYYTYDAYVKAYPDMPDPIFQLELRGNWPPKLADVRNLSTRK